MDQVKAAPSTFFIEHSAPRSSQSANQVPVAAGSADASRFDRDYQSFLRLLVAQLEHQDPMAPTDPTQFLSQLAQFSAVEQQMMTNSNLEAVRKDLSSSVDRLDLAYLGQEVEAQSDIIGLSVGKPVSFSYELGPGAESNDIYIRNEQGDVVHVLPGEVEPGRHNVVWDGKDAAGNPLPEGAYRISVMAQTKDGEGVEATVRIRGRVEEVVKRNGVTWLTLQGGNSIIPATVTRIAQVRDAN